MKNYLIGSVTTLIGIVLAIFLKEPHFYTFFSIGLFIIFLEIYKKIVHKKLFMQWTFWEHVLFWGLLLLMSIIIDRLGISLGYWYYPEYLTTWDTLVKFVFEWCIALMYVTLAFLIGVAILKKHKIVSWLAYLISLVAVIIPLGVVTEFLNHKAMSWVIVSMPFSQYSIGGYYFIFQTIGYWLMALIPWFVYLIVVLIDKKIREKNKSSL
jgi:hypothetical protein